MATIDEQIGILHTDIEIMFEVSSGNSVPEVYNNCKKKFTEGTQQQA